MHIHILGICGKFMGGIAVIAQEFGIKVTGSDQNCFPPMSTQLEEKGIALCEGYKAEDIARLKPDMVVVGNAMPRGNEAVEYVLNNNIPYTSGPRWLYEAILKDRHVVAVSGTHGKTTTTSIVAWVLEYLDQDPGFLVGGVPNNFGVSARCGKGETFVIEADEYDTAFFDKRSKMVHYHPRTMIINNLEFDHADIFDTLKDIQKQFHHTVRLVPGNGRVIYPEVEQNVKDTLDMGCWSEKVTTGLKGENARFIAELVTADGRQFKVYDNGNLVGEVNWPLLGDHNVRNALMAISTAEQLGLDLGKACEALNHFENVKNRMELKGEVNDIIVYDDFAHHPTAITTTLDGLRKTIGADNRIIAVLDPRCNTMRMGTLKDDLIASFTEADRVCMYQAGDLKWHVSEVTDKLGEKASYFEDVDTFVDSIKGELKSGDRVICMSSGAFGNVHTKIVDALKA